MAYKIDTAVLAGIAEEVVGQNLPTTELISHTTRLLATAYPDLIDRISDWHTGFFGPLQAGRNSQIPDRGPDRLLRCGIR